jgi:hypothetical protein
VIEEVAVCPHKRKIALALLTWTLLVPPHVAADNGPCFTVSGSSATIGDIRTVISGNATYASANAGVHSQARARLQLQVTFAPDGTARADGVIRIHDDAAAGGSATTGILAPYVPMLAVAKRVVGADCDDADGDGTAGLVRLELASRSKRGDTVPIVLTAARSDVDASGTYPIALRIGTETGTGEARVRLSREWFHSGQPSHSGS